MLTDERWNDSSRHVVAVISPEFLKAGRIRMLLVAQGSRWRWRRSHAGDHVLIPAGAQVDLPRIALLRKILIVRYDTVELPFLEQVCIIFIDSLPTGKQPFRVNKNRVLGEERLRRPSCMPLLSSYRSHEAAGLFVDRTCLFGYGGRAPRPGPLLAHPRSNIGTWIASRRSRAVSDLCGPKISVALSVYSH